MKKILIIAFAVLAVAGAAFMLTNKSDDKTATETPPSIASDASGAVITYTDNGFTPSSSTVSSGTTITIKNDSSSDLQFSSDDHPTHTKNQELNETTIGAGQTQTVTVTTKGTFGYHNHLNSSDSGTITVQ